MSDAATDPTPTPEPSRVNRLLDLVRKLIEYGKELATTLRQHTTPTDLAAATRPFGTGDIALILARITQGLHRANALEARLLRNAASLDAQPTPPRTPAATQRVSASPVRATPPIDPHLARLPTPEQIAAAVRRQPIGAVIADICRDLGIMPSHQLWRELQRAIIREGGSLARLVSDLIERSFPLPVPAAAALASPAICPPNPLRTSTGPP